MLPSRRELEERAASDPEAAFRLGLVRLFQDRDPEGSLAALRQAVRARVEPWSRQARVSAAQVLLATERPQQAAFELRKALGDDGQDLTGALARSLLVDALRTLGKTAEAERLRESQKDALSRLAAGEGPERARAQAWLGYELKHDGERRRARSSFEAALASGELPDEEREAVQRALESL
ncbi:MAG: hypothetical protein AAFZ18_26630 [Myxococcota bacterium]